MSLCHHMRQVCALTHGDGGPMRWVLALAGRCLGVAPSKRDRFGDPVAADGLLQEASRGGLVPGLRPQNVQGLAVCVDSPGPILPRAWHSARGCVPPPASPHRALAPMDGVLSLRAVCDAPALERGGGDRHATFEQASCDVARAHGGGARPADTQQQHVVRTMRPWEADRPRLSPPALHGLEGETLPQSASNENLRQNQSLLMGWAWRRHSHVEISCRTYEAPHATRTR